MLRVRHLEPHGVPAKVTVCLMSWLGVRWGVGRCWGWLSEAKRCLTLHFIYIQLLVHMPSATDIFHCYIFYHNIRNFLHYLFFFYFSNTKVCIFLPTMLFFFFFFFFFGAFSMTRRIEMNEYINQEGQHTGWCTYMGVPWMSEYGNNTAIMWCLHIHYCKMNWKH